MPNVSQPRITAEYNELFTHGLLRHHTTIEKEFHTGWWSKIIFTELTPCNEKISPKHRIPVTGIKGYGIVIFQFGHQMISIYEVAYIPMNPHNTFTSSHLQRMNFFLPGIHTLHSSVKIVNREGISTKYTPVVKNGLDYITIKLVIPKDISFSIFPSANHAKILTPFLMHQKCGHFYNGHIEELAWRYLIDGLPYKLPKMHLDCPICLQTKSNQHPRKTPLDYTLPSPGQQLHPDWYFIGETSVRGHTIILCIKCVNTHKVWVFPCTTKRTPLDFFQFFIKYLANQGIAIL